MADGEKPETNRAGTWQDWPAAVILLGVVLVIAAFASGGKPTPLGFLLIVVGAVALLIRRGLFAPRR